MWAWILYFLLGTTGTTRSFQVSTTTRRAHSLDRRKFRHFAIGYDTKSTPLSSWTVPEDPSYDVNDASGYRLYVNIGREEGTWMDPRWGASGRRIDFSLDILFTRSETSKEEAAIMIKDNIVGTSSSVYKLVSANNARLRNGFDRMPCHSGAYRIDDSKSIRFYINVDGTEDKSYGDVSIPSGPLYFSLPVFGDVTKLSQKEGLVSVRQMGWHTGWRRLESRILGVFRAIPIDRAREKDGY